MSFEWKDYEAPKRMQWPTFVLTYKMRVDKDVLFEFLHGKILAIGSKARKELQPSRGEIAIAHRGTDTNVAIKLDKPLTTRRPEELTYNGTAVTELKAMDSAAMVKEWSRATEIRVEQTATPTETTHAIQLRPWQAEFIDDLSRRRNARVITWYYASDDGSGKYYLCDYLSRTRADVRCLVYRLSNPPKDIHVDGDIATIVVRVPYQPMVEECIMHPSLYLLLDMLSTGEGYPACRVVVLANYPPYVKAISKWRWDIRSIDTGNGSCS
jgi:hypothetical protein